MQMKEARNNEEKSQLFKLFPSPEHDWVFGASEKEILSSFNPLLAFAHSQHHPQTGLWETAVLPYGPKMVLDDGHEPESLSSLGNGKRQGRAGKEVGMYSDDIF